MATVTPAPPETPEDAPSAKAKIDGAPRLLRPFVSFVARIDARLETKFLGGFLVISLLMLALGIVGLFVVNRMDNQVDRLSTLQRQSSNAQEMLYNITAQSHFRTMSLLTDEPVWADKIVTAKASFVSLMDDTEAIASENQTAVFDELRAIDLRYADAGIRVDSLIAEGDMDGALQVHILSEHEISHELEDVLNDFIRDTDLQVATEVAEFGDDRRLLTVALTIFSGMSLAGAIALGAIISWTVIGPVRKIDHALDALASGDFTSRVDVPNRDEFGSLSQNVNRASTELQSLYGKLETVNRDLQSTIDEQIALIEHTSLLRRYLSPQVAEAIVAGEDGIADSRRAELSIAFVDIRGFTAMSESAEPEEMSNSLNRFLTSMTNIVFKHEGTLDKYIGDALMVFFNDPVPQSDHAERAVRMALEMQRELVKLRDSLDSEALMHITAGIGISTGFVTVGNFGSPNRMDYTVMGNHVNLASRLSDDAGAGETLISERTLALLPPELANVEPVGERNLKGVQRPIKLYRVLPKEPA